eukprot:c18913_g2_i3.p1 GENE.c18913_g2_i3~~c18913_g2_i3.p1  ORF type:complete len:347 (+),score=71.65 c18913_g2_i3:40-1041(+)
MSKGPLLPEHVVVGCAPFGGMFNPVGDEGAAATVTAAMDAGIFGFDTAPHYAFGLSETRLGAAINAHPRAAEAQVWTKVGKIIISRESAAEHPLNRLEESEKIFSEVSRDVLEVWDYTAKGIQQSVEGSRQRMNMQNFYGLRIHDAESAERVKEVLEGGSLAELSRMKAAGEVTDVGFGLNVPEYAMEYVQKAPAGTIDSILIANSWNLLTQSGFELLCECDRRGIEIHIAGVFATGLLVGGETYKYSKAPEELIAKAAQWSELAAKHNTTLPAVALAFAWRPKVVTKILIGMRSAAEVRANVEHINASQKVPEEIWEEARALGLIQVPWPSS